MDTANAFLARVKTNERIELSKSEFCIGREEGCVDHLVTDNTAISRRHARFIRKDGGWFVEDLDSVNRTYLNGVALKAGKTFLLRDGDTVRLAHTAAEVDRSIERTDELYGAYISGELQTEIANKVMAELPRYAGEVEDV